MVVDSNFITLLQLLTKNYTQMKTKEFTIHKEYENIAILENGGYKTLKNCHKTFMHICDNNEMLAPEKFSEVFEWKENKETKKIEIRFVYHYIGSKLVKTGSGTYTTKENQICKTIIRSCFPFVFGLNWDIQQPFLIMEQMYINKLNTQILNKLN